MTAYLLMFTLLLWGPAPQQENPSPPKVPKDSVRLVVTGCLKGRMLAVDDVRRTDVEGGYPIKARSFRLSGKKDVMDEVKKQDKHLVEVEGLVKQSALAEQGMKIGKGVTVSGGSPTAGPGAMPAPTENIPVMDVWTLQLKGGTCGAK